MRKLIAILLNIIIIGGALFVIKYSEDTLENRPRYSDIEMDTFKSNNEKFKNYENGIVHKPVLMSDEEFNKYHILVHNETKLNRHIQSKNQPAYVGKEYIFYKVGIRHHKDKKELDGRYEFTFIDVVRAIRNDGKPITTVLDEQGYKRDIYLAYVWYRYKVSDYKHQINFKLVQLELFDKNGLGWEMRTEKEISDVLQNNRISEFVREHGNLSDKKTITESEDRLHEYNIVKNLIKESKVRYNVIPDDKHFFEFDIDKSEQYLKDNPNYF